MLVQREIQMKPGKAKTADAPTFLWMEATQTSLICCPSLFLEPMPILPSLLLLSSCPKRTRAFTEQRFLTIEGRTIPSWTSEMKVGAGDVRDGPGGSLAEPRDAVCDPRVTGGN